MTNDERQPTGAAGDPAAQQEPSREAQGEQRPETQETDEEVDILKEVSALGRNFGEALKDVWDSEERRRIEREFVKGMQGATDEVKTFAEGFRSGKARQDLKQGAEKVGKDVRKGLLSGLRTINQEMRRMRRERTGGAGGDDDEQP